MQRLPTSEGTIAVMALAMLAFAEIGSAAQPSSPPDDAWAPKLYGLCVDTHDAKKGTIPQQAAMLRELGFDGVGYPLWLDESLEENLRTLDRAGLDVFLFHTAIDLTSEFGPYDARLSEAIGKLKGRPATLAVMFRGFPPADPRGKDPAIRILRRLGSLAADAGLRISIYHHTGDWTASLRHALEVVDEVNHPQVGANFNLCHWLKVDGRQDYRPLLRRHVGKIFAVTINGAQLGSATWTDGLIQPLDRGDFDNRRLLATLREIGYRGPIGLMCYGILGDAQEHLQRSVKVWESWETDWLKQ